MTEFAPSLLSTVAYSDDRYRMPVETPKYQYLICDLLTDQLQASVALTGVTFDRRVSRAGSFRGTIQVSNRSQALQADQITKNCGRFAIWVLRNRVLWWGGILWNAKGTVSTREYDSIELQGASFESYPDHRWPDNDLFLETFTDTAIGPYALWTSLQNPQYSNIGVDTSVNPVNLVGSGIDLTIPQSELKSYGDAIREYTDSDPGCDYTIDVYRDATGARKKRLRTNSSFSLIQQDSRLVISGYRLPSWTLDRDATQTGTSFQAWGDAQDGNVGEEQQAKASTRLVAQDLLSAGWPRLDVVQNVGTVPLDSYQTVLDSYARALRDRYTGIKDIVSYEVDLSTSEWHPNLIGQNVLIKHSKKDLWRPGQTSTITPVVAEVTPPDRGQPERVKFTIDGGEED